MRQRLLTVLLALGVLTVPVWAKTTEVRVMTRNQYLGADLNPVIAAQTPAEFATAVSNALTTIALNDFPERALAMAREIADKQPHLIALQEVFDFTLNGANGAPPFRDHIGDLLDALDSLGAHYHVAATVENLDVTIPLSASAFVRTLDRDVILARDDVSASPVHLLGCAKPSVDGCNYQAVAVVPTPFGVPITVERGFVAVDALVGSQHVRFVDTHLESTDLPRIFQTLEAGELSLLLANPANATTAPVIIAGDINSSPADGGFVFNNTSYPSAYQTFGLFGFQDSWDLRPGKPAGFTCCQNEDLRNGASLLNQRIDVVLTNAENVDVKSNLVGDDSASKSTPLNLWPSDHAGVFARLTFK